MSAHQTGHGVSHPSRSKLVMQTKFVLAPSTVLLPLPFLAVPLRGHQGMWATSGLRRNDHGVTWSSPR